MLNIYYFFSFGSESDLKNAKHVPLFDNLLRDNINLFS